MQIRETVLDTIETVLRVSQAVLRVSQTLARQNPENLSFRLERCFSNVSLSGETLWAWFAHNEKLFRNLEIED